MKYIKLTGFSAVSHENVTYSATDDVFEVPDELGATMVAWGGNEVAKPLSAEELAANLAAAAAATQLGIPVETIRDGLEDFLIPNICALKSIVFGPANASHGLPFPTGV